jgi:hypothetical protein
LAALFTGLRGSLFWIGGECSWSLRTFMEWSLPQSHYLTMSLRLPRKLQCSREIASQPLIAGGCFLW